MTPNPPRDLAAELDALNAKHTSLLRRVARLEVVNRLVSDETLGDLPDHEVESITGEPTQVRRARMAAEAKAQQAKK